MSLSNQPVVQKISVSGAELHNLIFNKLAPACSGELLDHAVLAMLTLSVMMMRPNISHERMQEVVLKTSETLVLNLMDVPAEGTGAN